MKRWAWWMVLLSVVQFVALAGLAMAVYDGGTAFDSTTRGYHFWHNTFSDLGREVAISGASNALSARLYVTGCMGLLAGVVALWVAAPEVIPGQYGLGAVARGVGLAGVITMAGIALTAADTRSWAHMVANGLAGMFLMTASGLLIVGMCRDRSCPRWLLVLTLVMLASMLMHLSQYVEHFWLGGAWTPAAPRAQKIMAMAMLAWLVALSVRQLKRVPCGGRGT